MAHPRRMHLVSIAIIASILLFILLQHARYAAKLIVDSPFAKELKRGARIVFVSDYLAAVAHEIFPAIVVVMPVVAALISQPVQTRASIAFRVMVFAELVSDSALADGACVLTFEPLRDAICMEAMKARQDDIVLFDFILLLTDRTLLVLFAEVRRVGFCEFALRQELEDLARHRVDHILIELQELFILFRILPRGVLLAILSNLVLGRLIMVEADFDQWHIIPSPTTAKAIPMVIMLVIVVHSSQHRFFKRSGSSIYMPSPPPAPIYSIVSSEIIIAGSAPLPLHVLEPGEHIDGVASSQIVFLLLFCF